jgi:hypothetical protein
VYCYRFILSHDLLQVVIGGIQLLLGLTNLLLQLLDLSLEHLHIKLLPLPGQPCRLPILLELIHIPHGHLGLIALARRVALGQRLGSLAFEGLADLAVLCDGRNAVDVLVFVVAVDR